MMSSNLIETGLERVGRFIVPDAEAIVSGGDDRVVRHLVKLVAGELLANESIVGFVVVERADDIVAILPSVRLEAVALEAVGLGEADQVEPVAGPLFAEVGRGQERIDQPRPGIGERRRRETLAVVRSSAADR